MAEKADVLLLERILNSGLMEKAEGLLLEKLEPGEAIFFEKLGNIYRQQGKLSQAAEIYDRWAEKFPQSNKARYLSDLFNRRPLSVAWASGRFVPTPFQVREGFLPPALHDEFVRFAVDSQDRFAPSNLAARVDGEWKNIHDPELHNSIQINLQPALKKRYLAEVAKCLPLVGLQDYVGSCDSAAPFLLRHGAGNYFAAHTDSYRSEKPGISLVYYFSGPEGKFSGGANVFYDTDTEENTCDCNSFTLLPFAGNRLAVFPGSHYHGVLPVHLEDVRFGCGRFSVVTFLVS